MPCKDKRGSVLSEHGYILQRWKEYFCDLQRMSSSLEGLITENTTFNNIEAVPPPTYIEVKQVIDKLKIRKAAGSDNIPAELIKQGGIELKQDAQVNNESMGRRNYTSGMDRRNNLPYT
jgi:hypothetical protein